MRVAVLSGGRSSEHDVSLASGAGVASGLRRAGHEVLAVTLARDGTWLHEGDELALRPGRGLLEADVAFPVLHGPFGEDGTVQGLLELLDVPYVGSGVLASAVCLDKVVAKELLARAGIAQVDYAGVRAARWAAARAAVLAELAALGLPVFVKPARLGSSVGIAKVAAAGALGAALDDAFAHDATVIVEAMSAGIEVECSVLGSARAAEASQPGEIVLASDWYDFAAKYEPGGMQLRVPAQISETARELLRTIALQAFDHFGCAGLARADFFVEGERVLLNELNTMPGFTPTSVYAKLWEASGLAYEELVQRLCALAIERHAEERSYRF
ncbi:MAG: D-alanine--D-alanine ligase family protein [Solirubrobacteraceae bacterium]|nr:D-alanine--D-alanine ligase family protein [Solirubrobacteraceae bacterium]